MKRVRKKPLPQFAVALKAARQRAGYDGPTALARDLKGVTSYQAWSWESGHSEPGFAMFLKLCVLLRVNPDELLGQKKSNDPLTTAD